MIFRVSRYTRPGSPLRGARRARPPPQTTQLAARAPLRRGRPGAPLRSLRGGALRRSGRAVPVPQRFRLRLAGLEHRTLPAPRGTLSYWEGGKGPLLVLVHGLGNDAGIWAPVAPALLAKHRLLVIDLPGHGTSAPAS